MKKQIRPTRRQKIEIRANGLIPENWLVERDTLHEMVIVHRISEKRRVLRRGA